MPDVNYLAVLAAAVSAFALGGLWYSPVMFAKRWSAYVGIGEDQAGGSMAMIFGGAFVLSLIAAWVFALFLGRDMGVHAGTLAGLAAGLCWVATSYGITYLFERRPLGLWLINGGYHTLQFTLYGAIIGAMR